MKKIFSILSVLAVMGCSHQPDSFGGQTCTTASSNCRTVRVIHDVIEMKGISRPELYNLSACDQNTEFYRVKRYGTLNDQFFYGANTRACMATLYGCSYY